MSTTKPNTKPSAKIRALIRKANRAYNKATPAQRRVLIAQDVLLRLKKGQIRVETGVFVEPLTETDNNNLQEVVHGGLRCSACVIGSLFLSAVAYRNQYNLLHGDMVSSSDPLRKLKEFSPEQRRLIELAFERGEGYHQIEYPGAAQSVEHTPERALAAKWAYAHDLEFDSSDRLIALMENIIRNKGRFDPSER